jgi:hypothetical protein
MLVMDKQETQLELVNINQISESWKAVNQAMNSACKGGVFSLDEAYVLKTALMNLDKAVKTLDTHQQFLVKLNDQTKKTKTSETETTSNKKVGTQFLDEQHVHHHGNE